MGVFGRILLRKRSKNLLKIPDLLVKAVITYRKLYTVGATTEDMTVLLTKEDFHPFLAQDLSEYMKREKPPKRTSSKTNSKNKNQKKRGRKPGKATSTQSKEVSNTQVEQKEVSVKANSKTRRCTSSFKKVENTKNKYVGAL